MASRTHKTWNKKLRALGVRGPVHCRSKAEYQRKQLASFTSLLYEVSEAARNAAQAFNDAVLAAGRCR